MDKYSASDLIKKSARQMVFLRNKKERIINSMQRKGIAYQSKIAEAFKNKDSFAEELRGTYLYDNIIIFFCIDLYANEEFYEVKSIMDKDGNITKEYPQWYLEYSLLQCALYKSLLMNGDNDVLFTPKFRIKEGYEYKAQKVNKINDYYLIFGDVAKYKIDILNADKIIEFYKLKIKHLKDYDTATKFDNEFKRNEFNLLKPHFKYTAIQ